MPQFMKSSTNTENSMSTNKGRQNGPTPDKENMSEPGLDTSVVDWVIECPQAARLFEEFGIDYHCGGKSLQYACLQQDRDPDAVLARLRDLMLRSDANGRRPSI